MRSQSNYTSFRKRVNEWAAGVNRALSLRRKKRLKITIITCIVAVTLLAAVGFWAADSPRYWRHPAQAALFFAARHSPRSLVARVTRWALRMHVAGTSYAEVEEAALLLERAGESGAASVLFLGLVRQDVATQSWDKAISHALLSNNAAAGNSPDALASLVILNMDSPEFRDHWVSQLQERYPDSELAQVFRYLRQLKSFGSELPASCEAVDWVHQKALNGKGEYLKISQQIKDLPKESARNIKRHENSIAELAKEQVAYKSRYDALTADISRVEREGLLNAIGKWIWNMLPLPQQGDTLKSYVAREGICALPGIRWVCRALDLEPLFELRQEQRELTDSRARVEDILRLNESLITDHRSGIEYWQSSEPLNELVKARENLVPDFRRDIEQEIFSRRERVGVSVLDAITIATL